ncbi:CR2 protein, partial [Locustella ochotensis]|nr:CR2 protein [Locustella ochotensis]
GKTFLPLPFPAVGCPSPRVRYGSVYPRRYYYRIRDTVTFSCHPGYTLRGPRSSTCGADFRWDPPLPECRKGECPAAPAAGKAPS